MSEQEAALPEGSLSPDRPTSSRWTRTDRISLGALIIALLALLGSFGPGAADYLWGSKAYIENLSDGDVVVSSDISVEVRITNPRDMDYWLILKTGVEGKWYPQARIISDDNGKSPSIPVHLGSTGSFQISVYATDPSQGESLYEYFARPADGRTGLTGLPEGISQMALVSFKRE